VTSTTGVPERFEKLACRNKLLKPMLFQVVLKVLSILRSVWLSKSAASGGKGKVFVTEFI
jgi:hypothetical protein